jgi:predicted amidohydrolase YtcJ
MPFRPRVTAVAAAAAFALLSAACHREPTASVVAFGHVWTGDSTRPWAQAVAAVGDTIVAVGDSAEVARWVGKRTTVLAGPMVVPGLGDGHVHLADAGFNLASVQLRDVATPAEFVARIKENAARRKPGEWILGGDWDHERWPGAPLPRKEWIDSITPNNPVFVNRLDGHMALANSAALRAAKLDRSTPDIRGGMIVRDPSGAPTGVLKDEAMGPVFAAIPPATPEQMDSAVARALAYAASKGVTSMSAVSSPWAEVAAIRRAKARGTLTARIAVYPPLSLWRAVADTFKANGPGDDWLSVAGVKGYVDGSLGSTTALFDLPYLDAPKSMGLLVTPEDSLRTWIGGADGAGLQVVVHAIGERANELLLNIYDSVAAAHGKRDRRFRIEHAQHLKAADIDRIAKAGVIGSMQPYHAIDDGRWAFKRIRPEQIARTYAFRALLDRGAHLSFGSDWPVAPVDPLLGVYAAVTRRTLDGKNPEGWVPDQKITVAEALRGYTAGTAYATFAEQRRGVLRPGMLADLVVLDRDLAAVAPPTLDQATVQATVVGGKVVYRKH